MFILLYNFTNSTQLALFLIHDINLSAEFLHNKRVGLPKVTFQSINNYTILSPKDSLSIK